MGDALLPPEILESVKDVDDKLQDVETQLSELFPLCKQEILEELSTLDRAQTFFALSKTLNTLFSLFLRTNGLCPESHPAKSEIERMDLYQDKVQDAFYKSTAPKKPTSTLNVQAATRFIEHAIPDLPAELKQRIRAIGKKGGLIGRRDTDVSRQSRKKQFQAGSGQSIAEEAALFLAKAREEIFVAKGNSDDDSE